MDTEKTVYDGGEATQLDETKEASRQQETTPKAGGDAPRQKQKGTWKRVAVGAGTGMVFGAASTLFTSSASARTGNEAAVETENGTGADDAGQYIVDDDVAVATAVNDDMSFSQAFAAARAEVGPGGVFEWHGNLYGTYYAEEWDNMSAEERDAYNNHFSWGGHAASASASEEVEVIDHDTPQPEAVPVADNPGEADVVDYAEPEVEVIGVYHDEDSGANIGGVVVDGQGVVLIDVDGDRTFDVIGTDANHDGALTADELSPITGQSLTVDDLGGFTDADNNLYASDDGLDYSNDGGMPEV